MDDRVIEATYDYLDETGKFLFQVVRFKPKDFAVRTMPAFGQWQWGLNGAEKTLYRLPEVLAKKTQPVLVVEGEKDVESLRALGFVATCNPGGAGKWEPDFGRHLRGRRVAILPDNDEAGKRHALAVAASCLAWHAESIRLVYLPGLPDKGDVSDWLADSLPTITDKQKRESLITYIKAAPEWSVKESRGL